MDGERESWIEGHRNSDKSLGQVVMSTYINREAVWTVDENAARAARDDQQHPQSPIAKKQSKSRTRTSDGYAKGEQSAERSVDNKKPGQAIRVAKTLKDGTRLCAAFQQDKCRGKTDCWEGKHFCGGIQDSDRVCGGRHPACRCVNGRVNKRPS